MHLNDDYFRAIQGTLGVTTESDATKQIAAHYIARDMQSSVGYTHDTTRNGVPQHFLIEQSDAFYKSMIFAMPGEDIVEGDLIFYNDLYWLVVNVRQTGPIQKMGLLWMCNQKYRWQTKDGVIHEVPGVLDAGVYSTTVTLEREASTTNKQYKCYLQLNDDTRKLYIDKRIAIAKRIDADEREILDVYRITAYDPSSSSYGNDSHLLTMFLMNDQYNAETDDVDSMICDYRPELIPPAPTGKTAATISGKSVVRIGRSAKYSTDIVPASNVVWTVDADASITCEVLDDVLNISVPYDESLLGTQILLTANDTGDTYEAARKIVEVREVG